MRAKVLAVLFLTVAFLVAVMAGVDFSELAQHLGKARISWVIPMLLLYTLIMVARTYRFLLLMGSRIPLPQAFTVICVSFLAINVVPLRLGELVRPYLFAEKHSVPFGVGMAAVVMERLFDVISLLLLSLWVGWFIEIPSGSLMVLGTDLLLAGQKSLALLATVLVVGILVFAIWGEASSRLVGERLGTVAPALGPRIVSAGVESSKGFRYLASRPYVALGAAFWTLVMWTATLISFGCVMKAVELSPISPATIVTSMVTTLVGMNVLPTPGFVGGFEAGCVAGLLVFGVNRSLASAFALLFHALMLGHSVVLGVGSLFAEGWSLRDIVADSRSHSEGAR